MSRIRGGFRRPDSALGCASEHARPTEHGWVSPRREAEAAKVVEVGPGYFMDPGMLGRTGVAPRCLSEVDRVRKRLLMKDRVSVGHSMDWGRSALATEGRG